MLSRKAVAYLTDLIVATLPISIHVNFDHLLEKIDLNPSIAPGLSSSSGIKARVKSLFYNIGNDLRKVVEFLNVFFEEYGHRISGDDLRKIKPILESCGITVVSEEGYRAKLIAPANLMEESSESLLSDLLPDTVFQRIEEAREEYGNGKFDFVMSKCRTSLEALAKKHEYGTDFKRMIRALRNEGKIRGSEEDLMKKLYDFLSSFEATHAAPKPNKHQAFYALNLTTQTLLFLATILTRRF